MSDNKFDDYFRDRLQGRVSPVPADMWQRIHPHRRHRKGIFLGIWWLRAPALVLLVLTGLYIGHRPAVSIVVPSHSATLSGQTTPRPSIVDNTTLASQHLKTHITLPTSPVHKTYSTSQPATPYGALSSTLAQSPITLTVQRQTAKFDHLPSPPADSVKNNKKKQITHTPKWRLDAYASPDLPLNGKGRPSYTIGLRLGRSFGQHFSEAIGIQYSHIREISKNDDSMRSLYKLNLKTLDLPLLIGYKVTLGRARTTVTGGIIFNIHSWEKTTAPYPIGNLYKTNTGLSLYLGLNYIEPLNKKLSLFAEPYIRYRLSNMKDAPYTFPQKTHVAGLSLGLRYNF